MTAAAAIEASSYRSRTSARWALGGIVLVTLAGLAVGWNRGGLPQRAAPAPSAAATTAPDLQLYREMVAAVRDGGDYYAVGRKKLPSFGFPIHSPLNWRLPTYAWLWSLLPGPWAIQVALLLLVLAALALAFQAEARRNGLARAGLLVFLLFGALRWSLDGDAFLAQEVWAATLVLISLSAHALGWRWLAVGAGIVALLFRELAMPYCLIAAGMACWQRRWWETAGWSAGIAVFCAFFAWHVSSVQAQLAGLGTAGSSDLSQWLRCGGLDFVLLTGRMNSLLFAAPAAVLWFYLVASLFGLASRSDETSQVACLAALLYLLAFAIAGRPENFYWGLMYAPLLPWGLVQFPGAILRLGQAAFDSQKAFPESIGCLAPRSS